MNAENHIATSSQVHLDSALPSTPAGHGPRVTTQRIDGLVASLTYNTARLEGTTSTIATARLPNGFVVAIGHSACVSPENFDADLGRKYAIEDAEKKARDVLWLCEGYMLAQQMANAVEKAPDRESDTVSHEPKMPSTTGLDFGYALRALKAGCRVARAGWNGTSQWVALGKGSPLLVASQFWNPHARAHAEANGGGATVLPYFVLKTAQGAILMGWSPSQSDALADDWMIVE